MTTTEPTNDIDAVVFEILRHRLWAINDEAATTIARVSGSPVAYEANDFNAALLNAEGEVVFVGMYVLVQGAGLDAIVKFLLQEYSENPGIGPGDMFLTNDPFVATLHQADNILVAPIFVDDAIVAWSACTIHYPDVGGPVPGGTAVLARSMYEEPIPMAPIRIVEGGRLRKDIEREFLIRSRTPELNGLNLLGQIAANRWQAEQFVSLCSRYGVGTVTGVMRRLVETTEAEIRRRLDHLADGVWRYVGFVEQNGLDDGVYAVRLTMEKTGQHLLLDFTETADQAAGSINTTLASTRGFVLSAVLTILGFGLPFVPAAFWRVVSLRTRPSSLIHALPPAAVSLGALTGHEVRTAVNICLSRMLDSSPEFADRAMASSMTSMSGATVAGSHPDGGVFASMLIDSIGGGGGARSFADGADSSGPLHNPAMGLANVEVEEDAYPLLFLFRKERVDSGGPGRYRGGVGIEGAVTPHRSVGAIEVTLYGHGLEQPASSGVLGGEPGLQAAATFYSYDEGQSHPVQREDFTGPSKAARPMSVSELATGQVLWRGLPGGGGLGDPLDRPPEAVARDVEAGLVSVVGAKRDYQVAVVLDSGVATLMPAATARLRKRERARRLGGRPAPRSLPAGRSVGSNLALADREGEAFLVCARCGGTLGPADENVKNHLLLREAPSDERLPGAGAHRSSRFVVRRFYCPACSMQIDFEVNLAGEPFIWSVQPSVESRGP